MSEDLESKIGEIHDKINEMSEDHKIVRKVVLGPPGDPTKSLVYAVDKLSSTLDGIKKVIIWAHGIVGVTVIGAILKLVLKS